MNVNFINSGDIVQLRNANQALTGIVRQVILSANEKTAVIIIQSDLVKDGENFEIAFEKKTAAVNIIVPNNAINQDYNGYFIYMIKRRRGILGDEYFVERQNIFIRESDTQNTIVVRGITFFDPIVLNSSKALSPGMSVKLRNVRDFHEN